VAKKPAKSAKQKAETLGSLQALSEALKNHGVSRTRGTLSRITNDVRWAEAGFSVSAPWLAADLPAMARHITEERQENRREDGGGERPEGDVHKATNLAKLGLLVSRRKIIDLMREIKNQEYVRREEEEVRRAKQNEAIKHALMQIPRALRQRLADTTDPAEVEEILTVSFRNLCNEGFQ
jgi:hypothetical protein